MGCVVSEVVHCCAFMPPPRDLGYLELLVRDDALLVTTERKDRTSVVHIRRKGAKNTILYSHGNADNIGMILRELEEMADRLASDVLAYDYAGYGMSSGEDPSEDGCYTAIDCAYQYLLQCGVQPSTIVAFGESLGTGPTVDLVSRHPEVGGMVLLMPLESALRTASCGKELSRWFYRQDLFRSYEKIDKVKCPVLIMHGTDDVVVPKESGEALLKGCQHPAEPLFIEGHGHHDMPTAACMDRARTFIDGLGRHDS